MKKSGSESFVVEADALQQSSPKPHHLQDRLNAKKREASPSSSPSLSRAQEKRQAILNERRSKLSEKHERIKKAVTKTTERRASSSSTTRAAIDESIANAEKNRNEIIKNQREQNSKHVKKAKELAKQQQEKGQEEVEKIRLELEARLKTSEVRRQIAMRIPRSRLLDETLLESEVRRENNAAKSIQRWYRQIKFAPLVEKFRSFGLTMRDCENMSFDAMARKIQDQDVMAATNKMLLKAKKSMFVNEKYKNPTRVFLSAFMIVYHTKEIMPEQSEEQMEVKEAAEFMLKQLEKWYSHVGLRLPSFLASWHEFQTAFEAWKQSDTQKLLQGLFDHFLQLERLWDSVKDQIDAETEWKPRIAAQQKQIRLKIKRVGGEKAIKELDTQVGEHRELVGGSSAETSPVDEKQQPLDSVVNSKYHVTSHSSLDETGQMEAHVTPASASEHEDVPELQQIMGNFGGGVSNEMLAHELIMNPEFELKPNPSPLEARVREMAKKAFFDKIRDDINNSDFKWVSGITADIRQQLLEMVNPSGKSAHEIQESLDPEHIRQQAERGILDVHQYIHFITSKMLQLCAPVRDSAIRKIAELNDLPTIFERILSILDDMKLDLANYRLQALRPHLVKQAVEYERQKFEAALKAKKITLKRVTKWLGDAVKGAQNVAAARNPQNIDIPENRVKHEGVYFDALLSLISSKEPVRPDTCPETFILDSERMFGMQNEIQAITVVAALIMLTKNMVADLRDQTDVVSKIRDSLFVLLQDPSTNLENLSVHMISSINEFLFQRNKRLTEDQEKW